MLSFSEIIRLSLVDFCSDMLQAVERFIKRFGFLGEMEADQVVDVLAEETGTRNSADADVSRQHLTKFEVAFVTKFRNNKHLAARCGRSLYHQALSGTNHAFRCICL